MKRLAQSALLTMLTSAGIFLPAAQAQYPGYPPFGQGFGPGVRTVPQPAGYGSPTVSPYLNLVQRGFSPAISYYGIIRPQTALQNSVLGLQQQVQNGQAGPAGANTAVDVSQNAIPYTGHTVSFMNTAHYFGGMGGGVNRGYSQGANQRRPGGSSQGQGAAGGGAATTPRTK